MAVYGWQKADAGRYRLDAKFNDTILYSMDGTGISFYNQTPVARPSAYTQTFSTANKTHDAHTATSISATVPSNPPNVDEDGITAGAFITRAARRALVTTVTDLITHSTEMDLDYEALFVDVTDVKQLVNSIIDELQAVGLLQ